MKLQRLNIFNRAHKALRALLCNTLIQLQQTDFSEQKSTEICIFQLRLVLDVLEEHATLEDGVILPLIKESAASVASFFMQQHIEDEVLSEHLNSILTLLENTESAEQRIILSQKLLYQYIDFMAFNLKHMTMEERLINPLLLSVYADTELEKIVTDALKKSPPKHNDFFLSLMIEHQNNAEIFDWLSSIRETAPKEVFRQICLLTESILPEHRMKIINLKS